VRKFTELLSGVPKYTHKVKNKNNMENLKPNVQRAKNAITLIWVVLALEIVSLISGYFQFNLLQGVSNGAKIAMETAAANDKREQIIAIIHLIVFIISAVTFIQWFRRAYFNLHKKVIHLSQPEGWAAGSWFVPVLHLYRPYQIMKELYQETKGLLIRKGMNISPNFSTSALVWWWTLWILNNVIGQFVFRYSMKAESVDELIVSTIGSMISNFIGIPLAMITIKIIKDYSVLEPLVYELKNDEEAINV
jgi:hypothetical protein